jgi:hypothetical protein
MARATAVNPRTEIAKGARRQWVDAHPAVRKAQQELEAARHALREVPWNANANAYVDSVQLAKYTVEEATRAQSQAKQDAEIEFDRANDLDGDD